MNLFLLLMIILCLALIFIWFKNKFWRNTHGTRPSFSTSLARVRSSSFTDMSRNNADKSLSIKKLSRDRLKKSPYSVAMQRRTLVNPRTLEHKLSELEHLVAVKGSNGPSVNQRESNENVSGCTSSGSGH